MSHESPDRTLLSELVAKIVPVARRDAAEVDEKSQFPLAAMRALRESGLLGLLVPAQWGGLNGDLGDLAYVSQRLAAACHSTALIWAMHCQQVDALSRFGSEPLRATLLPRIARGELYIASVTTEIGNSGHVLAARSPLVHEPGSIVVERRAPVVTGGEHADGFLLTMRADAEATENRVTLVFADREQLTQEKLTDWCALGMRGTSSVGMQLTGRIPADQVVGEPGDYRRIALESMIPVGYLGWAACWLGTARAALAEVIDVMRSPRRPRGLNPNSELVQERLARVRIDLELVSGYLRQVETEISAARRAGESLDQAPIQIHINVLKVAAAELTYRAVDRLVQLSGLAMGYLKGSAVPLERYLRDLRSASLNYANDRLLTATGALAVMDQRVRLVHS